MESVEHNIKCVVCGNEKAICNNNYRTQEEFIHCTDCGYHRRMYITNWDKRAEASADNLWVPEYEIFECSKPFGAFDVRYVDGTGECGTFIEKENEEEFLDQVETLRDMIESATISKFVDGEIVLTKVV